MERADKRDKAPFSIVVTTTFGLESVVTRELQILGYKSAAVRNGRVSFEGPEHDIARCNIWLRAADRVLLEVARFPARDFEELFQGVLRIPWEDVIPLDGKVHVTGRSVDSKLFSVRDCQAITKKAIIEALKRGYPGAVFNETGALYKVEVSLLKDEAVLTMDTTGAGLHKRGYREDTGEAPLRETLAAGLVLLSRWAPHRILADPLCGSGTIAIEAALIGRNMAPGLKRSFASEEWPLIPKTVWTSVREEAAGRVRDAAFRILASDSDSAVLKAARQNAANAGVTDYISFQRLPLEEFRSSKKYGCIICNPPYGERIGDAKEVEHLYRVMGRTFQNLDAWSYFIFTAHPDFQRCFGRKSQKNRKIYNGDIKCYLYQYLGPLPRLERQ